MDTYIADDTYARLALALAEIEPCPFTGRRQPYQMVEALMAAEIWPVSVAPGELSAECQEQRRRG